MGRDCRGIETSIRPRFLSTVVQLDKAPCGVSEERRGAGSGVARIPQGDVKAAGATCNAGAGACTPSAPTRCRSFARSKRGNDEGFALLERWLGDAGMLFLRRDRVEPLVVVPWRVWARLLSLKLPL